jgi:hypothetical protein|tara:strand:- start:553 stop:747 length:195 start_codon:yes stop_codon:yes gene_type:complete
MDKKSKTKYFEDLPKLTMMAEVNQYLMEKGLTPFTALDRSNKCDIVSYVMNHNIKTVTPLKDRA